MRINIRPYYVTGLLALVLLLWAAGLFAVGESRTEYTIDFINGGSTERYSTYNWGAIITLFVLGLALASLTGWLQRNDVDWPKGMSQALGSIGLHREEGPGRQAQRSRLLLSGQVSGQQMHQCLLDSIAALPAPADRPAVYLLESVPGRLAVGFGVAGAEPLWRAEATITPMGPQRCTAMVVATATKENGQGLVAGEVLDAMFTHVVETANRCNTAVTATRAAHHG